MSYQSCEDCGCRMYGGICSNCQEELYIMENQSDYEDFSVTQEFMNAADEQRQLLKERQSR